MSAPQPQPEIVVLIDSEPVYAAVIRAMKDEEPSLWHRLRCRIQDSRGVHAGAGNLARPALVEIAPNGNGFTRSRRFRVGESVVNVLLIKPEDGQLFGWLTLAEFAQRVGIQRVLCISQALSLREDLHTGDIALVTRASALPYPALYASRPPQHQAGGDEPRKREDFYLSDENLAFARELATEALPQITQERIPEVHTGYARHPVWSGGMMPWASEQFDALRAEGLETVSEIAVGVCDFAQRMPSVPVVCLNVIAGGIADLTGPHSEQLKTDGPSFRFSSGYNTGSSVRMVLKFLQL